MTLEPGDLSKRLCIERPDKVKDDIGKITETWVEVSTVWAQIVPLTSNEVVRARQAQLQNTHKIRIYHFPGLTSKHRLKHATSCGTSIYNITGIIHDERKQRTEITAVEVSGG